MIKYEDLFNLLKTNRSYRRFEETVQVSRQTLEQLVSLSRITASGRNAQPLKYRMVTDPAEREALFPALAWAGYFKDWPGPAAGERPAAYLIQCLDSRYGTDCLCDDGLQLEAITLGATTLGLGCCIIKAFDKDAVKKSLELPEGMEPRYVLALGKPAEKVVIEDMTGNPDDDFKYYRTPDSVHHVPKRPLSELIID